MIINTRNRIWWWKSNDFIFSESHSGYVFITNYCSKLSYTTGITALMSIYYRSILGYHYFQTSVDNFQCAPDCLVHHCSNLNKSFLVRCSIAKCLPRIMNNLKKSRLMCSSDSFSNFEFWICQFCWRIFVMITFSTDKLRKKLFGPKRNLFSFSTAQTRKIRGRNWGTKLVKTSDEFIYYLHQIDQLPQSSSYDSYDPLH